MGEYITKSGETLSQVAQNMGVSVEVLKQYTKIKNENFIFSGQVIRVPDISADNAFNITGLTIERLDQNNRGTTAHATKNSKVRATAKDIELLKSRGASLDVNDPNGQAQFVEGNEDGEVYISAANSRIPKEGDTLESPDTIKITDNTNGHKNTYYYYKLTPEMMDGKHFAKADKDKPIDKSQFEEGKTYYILFLAVNEDTHERLDYTDHLEIYRLDYSYDPATDTSNYDLVQEKGMQGSGQSSIDYNKR